MTERDEPSSDTRLNATTIRIAETFVGRNSGVAGLSRDDDGTWLVLEHLPQGVEFAETDGSVLRVVPFLGDADTARALPFVSQIHPSWLDGELAVDIDTSSLASRSDQREALGLLQTALEYWTTRGAGHEAAPESDVVAPTPDVLLDDVVDQSAGDDAALETPAPVSTARMTADVASQWSWASAAARIPQITDLNVAVVEPVQRARVSARLADSDIVFGETVVFEGQLPAGTSSVAAVHLALSARVMSQIDDRRGAMCELLLEDLDSGQVLARVAEAVDVQPRDLWLWGGDPKRSEQRVRMLQRLRELESLSAVEADADALVSLAEEAASLSDRLAAARTPQDLAESLLASFVRPNHPEVSKVAREAADRLGAATGDASFFAFQIGDVAASEQRADDTVTAVYDALRSRQIVYSEPPPGWDYRGSGQRIRDHGEVARGGLGTCMDTTVLMAAVLEEVGLQPVLVLVPGHIFVGYWRRQPIPPGAVRPEWYPDRPYVADPSQIDSLVRQGFLGVIETTALTVGKDLTPSDARKIARGSTRLGAYDGGGASLIDVAAARRAGVSPLPSVVSHDEGTTEIIEYVPGGGVSQSTVDTLDEDFVGERQVDDHPARYRTWKSSLFTLNATNALLNLPSNAKVQPVVLPPDALGVLEDRLHQDVSFTLTSGYDLPAVTQARGVRNAVQLLESGDDRDRAELRSGLENRQLYVQRIGRARGELTALSETTLVKELRSMAHGAKTSRDERGMNPLFLCIGLLRWQYKPGQYADAPLILVPVNVTVSRGRRELTLSLDTSQQTTPNAALLEWLRREHELTIPGLAEPLTDRAGIDVDGVLAEVRAAVAARGLAFDIRGEARLATLDLSAFRMWQDLDLHAESFMERPLVRHLVETPDEQFDDPATADVNEVSLSEDLDKLDTPIPADVTQKQAVLWARQGRTFVLQGPPGTGKSQTITNVVAECVMSGLRVLFVAEKGTALSVVQRRLDAIGLGPFTLNLHHEGSNSTQVRAQLKLALNTVVDPDPAAMETARRRLRSSRFELMEYPRQLHESNAAGLSAYSARDEQLVLGEGLTMALPEHLVAHQADTIDALRELFEDLQPWTSAAGVRPAHPWRLAGAGSGEPFDLDVVRTALEAVLAGNRWARELRGELGDAIREARSPAELRTIIAAGEPRLPPAAELSAVLEPDWQASATTTLAGCERSVGEWLPHLNGFDPAVIEMDLRAVQAQLQAATASGMFGRRKRQAAALAPIAATAPSTAVLDAETGGATVERLIATQDAAAAIRATVASIPGLTGTVPANPLKPGSFSASRQRLDELEALTANLRGSDDATRRALDLARQGALGSGRDQLRTWAEAWTDLESALVIDPSDREAWLDGQSLVARTTEVAETWRRQFEFERLLPLQHWCALVRKLAPLRDSQLEDVRHDILDGSLPADQAEDSYTRGLASASLGERIAASGLDRFSAVAQDERVEVYAEAQRELRRQWVTDGPAELLRRRGARGRGEHTGKLERELEKTTRKLGARPILRKYGAAVQELTPLVLCSPSSVVDLIEPGVMEFDVVVFDEASQITVPEAVGALGRAKAAIVVGDSKQMPPTRRVGGSPSDADDAEEADEVVEDQESILSECEIARVPTLSLSWHYRSQDEALIAFSNRTYYAGELSSFPTPTLLSSDTGLELRRVDGQYLRAGAPRVELDNGVVAGSNTNPAEARAIVSLVEGLVRGTGPLPSMGIVTFNEQQRQLIEDLLLVSGEPRVADVMDDSRMGRGDVLFVKALEQVQGDERDTVIFSIAFSKQANGKIPTNFGPLSNSGGERRLNVAVTRARRKNLVFCSFDPAELDVAGSAYDGPRHLKEFLTFAKAAGSSDSDDAVARTPVRDRHRDDIADALRAAGLHVMSDVGMSNFRLDLVLAQADRPDRPLLPVLLDGESWTRRRTVSDRDVLPVEVLTGLMGWPSVARVWWPMWLQNREEVVDHLVGEVERLGNLAPDDGPLEPPSLGETDPGVAVTEAGAALEARPVAADMSARRSVVTASVDAGLWVDPDAPPELPFGEAEAVSARGAHSHGESSGEVKEFVPAHTEMIGDKDVLDALPDKGASARVRAEISDVIETEGPVEIGRLTRLVARRFGLSSVRAARAESIERLVPKSQRRRHRRLGSFAWPTTIDPDTWTGFRFADAELTRSVDEIAPEELVNGMRAVMDEFPDLVEVDDVLRRTAEIFGFSRLGANVRSRLEAIYSSLVRTDEGSQG